MKRKVKIVPPEKFEKLILKKPKHKAAGIPAVLSSLDHLSKELGIFKGLKIISKMNQKKGFDCSGCAWPDPDGHRSKLGEYCENGAKALAEEMTDSKVGPAFFAHNSVEEMSEWSDFKIGKSGRITHPMYLSSDRSHYKKISWKDAFDLIAKHLNQLDDPNEAVFYTSGRTSNEAAFMYQLLARQLGTNNLPDCSNMCHESSGKGLSKTLGIGKGSVTLSDLHEAELIIVMGQNPGTNHPRMLSALSKCKKNGGKIVSVNPLPEAGLECFVDPQNPVDLIKGGQQISDLFLQVQLNGDIALLKAVMYLLLQEEQKYPGQIFDLEFIDQYCSGYDNFLSELSKLELNKAIKKSGISKEKIHELVDLIKNRKKIIICWAMGITQQPNGVENVQEIVNLLLLKGAIGKPGAGTCPVRGHSNVQGDRTMGIWEAPPESFLNKLDHTFKINSPRAHGYDVVNTIEAMAMDKVKVFIALGGNFISATPDSQFTGEALQNCDLTVQISTKLNRSHLVTGKEALILPCISRAEIDIQQGIPQFVSVENSMGIVHSSQGAMEPSSIHLKSEPAIIAGIAETVFGNKSVIDWNKMIQHYDVIRDHIADVVDGFENYNQKIKEPEGFYLPNGARERNFKTSNGKANFTINQMPENHIVDGRFIMMTIRTHDQYNTTIYGMDDRYRGIINERRVVLMHPKDMEKLAIGNGQVVHFRSFHKGQIREAKNFKAVSYNISKGCVATYFPEANALVHLSNKANISNTPASKFIEVEIFKDE